MSNKLVDLLTEATNISKNQRNNIRQSERLAEIRENDYERTLEKAKQAERLQLENQKLQRELKKHENVLQRAAEADRLERDNVFLHEQYRRWKGIAKARMEELNHHNRDK